MYIEIGKVEIEDKYYAEEICNVLKQGGFETALIFEGTTKENIRILRKKENKGE